jgi:DNA-binding transcriptional MerR regulator
VSNSAPGLDRPRGGKGREAFRTISEVADELDLPQHVLRFWESKFSQIKPLKRGGNRRYYRPDDVTLLKAIKKLLHADGYTIRGVQKLFKAQGVKTTVVEALELADDGASSDEAQEAAQAPAAAAPTSQAPAGEAPSDAPEGLSREARATIGTVLASLKRLRAGLD